MVNVAWRGFAREKSGEMGIFYFYHISFGKIANDMIRLYIINIIIIILL